MKNFARWSIRCAFLLAILALNAGGINFCSWSTESAQCAKSEFRCLTDGKCINRDFFCNGARDCTDNSDERYCSTSTCPENFIPCSSNGRCIPKEWICNGYNDCLNNNYNPYGYRYTDETDCSRSTVTSSPAKGLNRTAVNNVKRWFTAIKSTLSSTEKWGTNVDRLALITHLAAQQFSTSENDKTEMAYELNIQLLSRLSSMKLEDIPSTELASFLNAFLAMCINPKNFHGHNIVQELRNRANNETYTNPYVLLALCNAGETITESDKSKLIDTFENKRRTFWTDMQAVVVMALACANKQPGNEVDIDTMKEMTLELKQEQYRNGSIVNLPTTALVMQALISVNSESDPDNFDETKALQELLRNQQPDGSFGDMLNTFLVTPVLLCKSLVDVKSDHCQYESVDEISALEKLSRRSGPKIRVQYSLWIGKEKDLERNLILRVPENMSLYAIMELGAELDSRFKFEYSVKTRKPYINALSGMKDNPLTGKFWFLYVVKDGQSTLSSNSPADIVPKDNEHYVMWYRRGTWTDGSLAVQEK